jgi:ribonuclease Z
MASRSAAQSSEAPLSLHAPAELEEYLRTCLTVTHTRVKYPWSVAPVEEGLIYEDKFCTVECRLLNHGIASYGYAIIEKEQPGEFLPDKAKELGVIPGPDFGVLKAGHNLTLGDGRVVRSADVTGPPRLGRKIVICGDTGITEAAVELAQNADVLVHEATFMSDLAERALQVGHSTAAQAAAVAKSAGVGQLILTHFSPRYEQENSNMMGSLLMEAQETFPNTLLAEDLLVVDVAAKNVIEI